MYFLTNKIASIHKGTNRGLIVSLQNLILCEYTNYSDAFNKVEGEKIMLEKVLKELPSKEEHPLAIPVGYKKNGELMWIDIYEAPHILLGGEDKDEYLKLIISTLTNRNTNKELELVFVDTGNKFDEYNESTYLNRPVANTPESVSDALCAMVETMRNTYGGFNFLQVPCIKAFNKEFKHATMPYKAVIINNIKNFTKEDIDNIVKLGQKSRAAGIHMIITGDLDDKKNIPAKIRPYFPTRICFKTESEQESINVIGDTSAYELDKKDELIINSYVATNNKPMKLTKVAEK